MTSVVHVLNGLEVGGKERVALQLAWRARREGLDARLVLFDTPFRDEQRDLDPGGLAIDFLRRGPGLDLPFTRALARRLREHEVDLVHAHNDSAVFYACAAARLVGSRRPGVCATFHVRPGHATRAGRLLTRLATRRAGAVTAVSDDLTEFVLREGWAARCETVWNGIDLDEFSPAGPGGGWRARLELPSDVPLVAHIGRFDPLKRQVDLVDAARSLVDDGVPACVVLVGQGPTLPEVEARARGAVHVRFVPRVVDVAAFLREVDVFVLCSEQEAAPRVLLEAMACARAIVATRVGGVPAMLGDGEGEPAGLLVEPGRPAELAAALRALLDDARRREQLGARARRAAGRHSSDREWSEYAERYRALLA